MKIYAYNVIAFNTPFGTVADLYGLTDDTEETTQNQTPKECVLRMYNFEICFYLMKLPGMDLETFREFCAKFSRVKLDFVTDLKENGCFLFDIPQTYAKFSSNDCNKLNNTYISLLNAVNDYFSEKFNYNEASEIDKIIFDNTEDPFRFTRYTLSPLNVPYYLAAKYGIGVGGIEVNGEKLAIGLRYENEKGVKTCTRNDILKFSIDCGGNGLKHVKPFPEYDKHNFLRLMSYDIETYNMIPGIPVENQVIMCIGVSFSYITEQKPYKKLCLSIKDLTNEDKERLKNRLNVIRDDEKAKIYEIFGEMFFNDKGEKLKGGEYNEQTENDKSAFYIFNSERDMLVFFIKLIAINRPHFVNGFNNYKFDDGYTFNRLKLHRLDVIMKNTLNNYDLPQKTFFDKFTLKIDSQPYDNNATFFGDNCIFIDTYKILLASNAKYYTQKGNGTLKNMLKFNKIKNPYTGGELDKYDLSYATMYKYWDAEINIYEILHYCMYDALTCGALLVRSAQIVDKIEMSILTCTSIYDSFYRAVTSRIAVIINKYGYDYGFALDDSPLREK